MSTYLDDVFGPHGALAARWAGYAPRQGQVSLAQAVDAALSKGTHLLAEAPTGTGKSVAYSVPAIFHAVRRREANLLRHPDERTPSKVVIVTANIALQEQLVSKDLPMLAEILPWKFTYALLKGRSNYLCLDRLEEGAPGKLDPEDFDLNEQIARWADHTETGDKSELSFEPPDRLWSRYSVSADECTGGDCPRVDNCFGERARKTAAMSDVIVTNYHLLFADMKVRESSGGFASILPPYYSAILDEGHEAVDIARDFFGFRITERSISWAASMLDKDAYEPLSRDERKSMGAFKKEIEESSKRFFMALGSYKRSPRYKARIREQNILDVEELTLKLSGIKVSYENVLRSFPPQEELKPEERKLYRKFVKRLERAFDINKQIQEAMRLYEMPKVPWREHPEHKGWFWSDPELGGNNEVKAEKLVAEYNSVYFIDDSQSNVSLCSKPISVAKMLQQHLFDRREGSVSVTSATLMAKGSFDHLIEGLGVSRPALLEAMSPFNFAEQALLILPQDVPEPNDPRFLTEAAERCAQTIELARGRTLALFTSKRGLNAAHERALRTGYRILKQGDMPRTQLINEFRSDVNSVLMGVASFWAGVDVSGESLSCVFIDKLPFIPPDDPVLDALAERDKDSFNKYSVPHAIIELKQGFGRLIRSTTDRGVVVVLDKRLTTKFYGRQFLASLPSAQRSFNLGDVQRFLDREPLVITATPPAATNASLFDRV